LLLKVRDVMRGPGEMAVVRPEQAVREVLAAMGRCRAGAAVAVDHEGKLAGIFTHSDFARHFQTQPDLGELAVEKFLTRNPKNIRADKLAVEVLHLIQQYRIDDLVVVDEENRPIGVVDSQDLARFRLV
jgi:arabinose-5-phosphate isomerase